MQLEMIFSMILIADVNIDVSLVIIYSPTSLPPPLHPALLLCPFLCCISLFLSYLCPPFGVAASRLFTLIEKGRLS